MSPRSYLDPPAKSIQRLMIIETLRRLRSFAPLSEYEYIGFGAHEFVDFELVWRYLGLTRLTSIEETIPIDRYLFNAPFGAVNVEPGQASSVLPNLALTGRAIVWLDYTRRLDRSAINDVNGLVRRLVSGSVVIVTVNATPEDRVTKRLAGAIARLGRERVPRTHTDASFGQWGLAVLTHSALADEVLQTARSRGDGATAEQLLRFHYQDTSKMLTWAGVIVTPAERPNYERAAFADLPFKALMGDEPVPINPPPLTIREIVRLNAEMPPAAGMASPLPWLSDDDFHAYARLHRWYPRLTS